MRRVGGFAEQVGGKKQQYVVRSTQTVAASGRRKGAIDNACVTFKRLREIQYRTNVPRTLVLLVPTRDPLTSRWWTAPLFA